MAAAVDAARPEALGQENRDGRRAPREAIAPIVEVEQPAPLGQPQRAARTRLAEGGNPSAHAGLAGLDFPKIAPISPARSAEVSTAVNAGVLSSLRAGPR